LLVVNEIYTSIAGETSHAGLPCTFVRLAGCNLDCAWCDTPYARTEGQKMERADIVREVLRSGTTLVCVTGGEPLLQDEAPKLVSALLRRKKKVLVETNGSLPINVLPEGASRIVDAKTPSSGEEGSFRRENIKWLRRRDELKFVVADMKDFDWAVEFVEKYKLEGRCGLLISPAWIEGMSESRRKRFHAEAVKKLLTTGMNFRYNIQVHKYLWGPGKRRV